MENNNELQHWGVPGMKWGIRRYQNKDGSLTPAGRKRADKLKQKYLQVTGKKLTGYAVRKKSGTSNKSKVEPKKNENKTIDSMTDDELKSKVNRLRLENDYINQLKTYNQLHPKKVSLGRKFVEHVGKNVLLPAATEAGKNYVRNMLNDLGKSNNVDPFKALKKEVETLELQKRKLSAEDAIFNIKKKQEKRN